MVVFRIPASVFCSTLLLGSSFSLFSQQANLQIALFPKAIANLEASTTDTTSRTYIEAVTQRPAPFRPNASDLLIAQAEERFQGGKRAYQIKDTATARGEFDSAIDLMLRASDNPTDRVLYESKLEQMVDTIHRFDLAGLGAGMTTDDTQFEKAPLDDIVQMTFPVDPKIKGKVLEELKATSSQLPLAVNDAVLGYINYFSGRGRKTLVAGLERSGRFQAMISRILAQEGVPQELIHLAQAESGFLPRAVSYRAAVGMWQFVQFRGREYGLQQTQWTDDRLDPERATRAAAKHLHDLYNHFGDWYLAIAAYNCGPNAVDKAVERSGYADYWELRSRHLLPAETTNYVPIILAMTIMSKNAAEYGLTDLHPVAPMEYDTVGVTSPTHLALVGDLTDTPVSQLTDLNQALLHGVAPAGYELHIPRGSVDSLRSSLDVFPADHRDSWRMHRVESGETLASIAHRYKVAPASIESENRISAGGPRPGDRLIIPAVFHPEHMASASPRKGSRYATHRTVGRRGPTRSVASRGRARKRAGATVVSARVHHSSSHGRA